MKTVSCLVVSLFVSTSGIPTALGGVRDDSLVLRLHRACEAATPWAQRQVLERIGCDPFERCTCCALVEWAGRTEQGDARTLLALLSTANVKPEVVRTRWASPAVAPSPDPSFVRAHEFAQSVRRACDAASPVARRAALALAGYRGGRACNVLETFVWRIRDDLWTQRLLSALQGDKALRVTPPHATAPSPDAPVPTLASLVGATDFKQSIRRVCDQATPEAQRTALRLVGYRTARACPCCTLTKHMERKFDEGLAQEIQRVLRTGPLFPEASPGAISQRADTIAVAPSPDVYATSLLVFFASQPEQNSSSWPASHAPSAGLRGHWELTGFDDMEAADDGDFPVSHAPRAVAVHDVPQPGAPRVLAGVVTLLLVAGWIGWALAAMTRPLSGNRVVDVPCDVKIVTV